MPSVNTTMTANSKESPSRAALRRARRVVVKAGTSVVANEDGRPSLTRLGAIAEQISELVSEGVEVIFVSSGAVGMGKNLLRRQSKMLMTFKDIREGLESSFDREHRTESFTSLLNVNERPHTLAEKKKFYDSACAAAGQFEMMNLYSSLFAQCNVSASQLLVTQADFKDDDRISNIKYALERLLSLGVLPIINENDAVSGNKGYTADDVFSDNDQLAAICARAFGAEALLLLTDVEGVYDRPPSEPHAQLLSYYNPITSAVEIGDKSAQGRGGMASKIGAAMSAVQPGAKCTACVVASGHNLSTIRDVLGSRGAHSTLGTLFCTPGSDLEKQAALDAEVSLMNKHASNEARLMANKAREEARKLQALPFETRKKVLNKIADMLIEKQEYLILQNDKDLLDAEKDGLSLVLKNRLKLTVHKIRTLADGIRQIASLSDPLGVVKSKRELSDGLNLTQITVPIGVIMIIFESRPDSMPQISALALASGNALLLKGGKEAKHSNSAIHRVIGDAIEAGSEGKISREIVALVTSRSQVKDMLALDDVIDLIIPRGSNALVSYIKSHTRIPVLGHADGVCHIYVDETADSKMACDIVVDAKVDYPSACNAMETLLLHRATLKSGIASQILMALRSAGVKCLGGPSAMKAGLCDSPATEMKFEYGDLACLVEVVDNVDEAINWIHQNGSGHTESIICDESSPVGEVFLKRVDSACVFKNASTRFADGFRFGLGAEVGISTGRIHARGPVGVEGLLTTKWQLRSSGGGSFVGQFAGDSPERVYTHKDLE